MAGAEIATPPIRPDFLVCDRFFGVFTGNRACLEALEAMPTGAEPIDWEIIHPTSTSNAPHYMPIVWAALNSECSITLEAVAINSQAPGNTISMAPDKFRGMAGWVINRCGGQGGFITAGISNTINYLINPTSDLTQRPPASSIFYTITVKDEESMSSRYKQIPGVRDPAVAGALYKAVQGAQEGGASISKLLRILGANWERMTRGGPTAWYRGLTTKAPIETHDHQMAYMCNTKLGKPAQVDCSNLQYSELGPPSDTVTVGVNMPKTLRSGTCNVAISADQKSIVLTWAQIIAAVVTLIEICVDNPLGSSQGGVAVAGTQQSLLDLRRLPSDMKKKKTRRFRRRDITGLNALPRGVNVTVSGPR